MTNAANSPRPANSVQSRPAAEPSLVRLARRTMVVTLLVWGAFYLVALARYPGAGSDFADFYAASRATAAGENPYDWPVQWRWEDLLLNHGSGHLPGHYSFAPYGNPPPFASLLIPLTTTLAPRPAYLVWAVLTLLATIVAAAALARWAGYARSLTLGILLAAAPCATFDLFLGQDSWLVLLALATALSLVGSRPTLAGIALVLLACEKPHLMAPLAAVIFLAFPNQRRPLSIGLALGVVLWLALSVVLAGSSALHQWVDVLTLYRQSISAQPDIASLPGLYTSWAPSALLTLLDALLLAGCAVLMIVFRARPVEGQTGTQRSLALGVAASLAVMPYAHTHDDILLVVPLLLLMGPDWRGLRQPFVMLAAAVTLLAPLAIWTDYHRPVVSALPGLCTLVACLIVYGRNARSAATHLPQLPLSMPPTA